MMRVLWLVRASLVGCLVLGTVAACGDGGGKSGPPSYVGEESSALIQADEGGDVAVGAVKLKVPAAALEKDTRLSVKVSEKKEHPDGDRIAIDVYEFGPKGTTFSKEVQLKFDLKGVKIDKMHRAEVAMLDEETNVWKTLPDSRVEGGEAVATTKHFSFYTVLLTEVGEASEVVACDADFVPCGGDLAGLWEFTSGCVTGFSQGMPTPVLSGSACDGTLPSASVSVSGSAHFGTEQDTNIDQVLVVNTSFSIPLDCLAEVSRAGGTLLTCDDLGGVIDNGNCTQSSTSGDIPSMVQGTYMVEGGKLTIESPDGFVVLGLGTVNPNLDYCVQGDTLTLRVQDSMSEGNPQVYVAKRTSSSGP